MATLKLKKKSTGKPAARPPLRGRGVNVRPTPSQAQAQAQRQAREAAPHGRSRDDDPRTPPRPGAHRDDDRHRPATAGFDRRNDRPSPAGGRPDDRRPSFGPRPDDRRPPRFRDEGQGGDRPAFRRDESFPPGPHGGNRPPARHGDRPPSFEGGDTRRPPAHDRGAPGPRPDAPWQDRPTWQDRSEPRGPDWTHGTDRPPQHDPRARPDDRRPAPGWQDRGPGPHPGGPRRDDPRRMGPTAGDPWHRAPAGGPRDDRSWQPAAPGRYGDPHRNAPPQGHSGDRHRDAFRDGPRGDDRRPSGGPHGFDPRRPDRNAPPAFDDSRRPPRHGPDDRRPAPYGERDAAFFRPDDRPHGGPSRPPGAGGGWGAPGPHGRPGAMPSSRHDAGHDTRGGRPHRNEADGPTEHEHVPGSLRLSKRMAQLGLASRREADEWIERGWVRVDGRVVSTLGARVLPDQKITLDAHARNEQARRVTVLLHKPVGYVSGQAEDGHEPAFVLVKPEAQWHGDTSGTRFEAHHLRHLVPAGRLDIDSTGLLVLTQDGRIAKQLIGEDSEVEKEYLVRIKPLPAAGEDGEAGEDGQDADAGTDPEARVSAEGADEAAPWPSDATLALLRHGLELDGEPLKPAQVDRLNADQLRFVLTEGKKRQIRRMCEAVGLKVVGLKRVRVGRIVLGDLPLGQWRYLRLDEAFVAPAAAPAPVPAADPPALSVPEAAEADDKVDAPADSGRQEASPAMAPSPESLSPEPSAVEEGPQAPEAAETAETADIHGAGPEHDPPQAQTAAAPSAEGVPAEETGLRPSDVPPGAV